LSIACRNHHRNHHPSGTTSGPVILCGYRCVVQTSAAAAPAEVTAA
jgi:hypothetical protein